MAEINDISIIIKKEAIKVTLKRYKHYRGTWQKSIQLNRWCSRDTDNDMTL